MGYFNGTFRSYFGAICVPILDKADGTISNVTHDWANAAAGLGGGLAVTVLRLQLRNQRVDIAKERLAEQALQNNVDWLFFLDDDVLVPGDALMKMIKLWKSDPKYKIISGVYFSKPNPAMPLIFKDTLRGSFWDWTDKDLIKADGAGAGCLFIDANVLKKMPKPWFSCNYFYEDPRGNLDNAKWNISNLLSEEIIKGEKGDPKLIEKYQQDLREVAKEIAQAQNGEFDPNSLKDIGLDNSTTEDLYFFKKAKETLGDEGQLWIDCSIQCGHQDKRTGQIWQLTADMPQARPRYEGRMQKGDKVLVDIGAGISPYWLEEGTQIRVDLDPDTHPDIVADARQIPLENCFADMVFASHILEHFSFRETNAVLKEWTRILKVDGRLVIVVPNLKWASKRIMEEKMIPSDEAERVLFMYFSGQKGDLRQANEDFHKAGFTSSALKGLLSKLPGLTDVEVYTTDANLAQWNEPNWLHDDDLGYNIIAFAKKAYHDAPISLKLPIMMQEEAKKHIGPKAKTVDIAKKIKDAHQPTKEEKPTVQKVKAKIAKPKKSKRKIKRAIAQTEDLRKVDPAVSITDAEGGR